MKWLLIMACLVAVFFSSCNKKVKLREIVYSDSLFHTIIINPEDLKQNSVSKVSQFCSEVEYIPLETSDSVLIGNVKRMYVWNDNYYIWDGMMDVVFCFDKNGRFLHRLDKKGGGPDEYYRITDMFLDKKNGNICIYSDMSQAIFIYTEKGDFIQKISLPLIISSIALENDKLFTYLGRMPNSIYFRDSYPEQYRFLAFKKDSVLNQQLVFTFHEKWLKLPVSSMNFTPNNEGVLFTEHLDPTIYQIDSLGCLKPKYKIKFLTNALKFTYNDDISVDELKKVEESGAHTSLFGAFFENNHYAFFNYSKKLVGGCFVTRTDGLIHNLGYLLFDDFNNIAVPMITDFIDDVYLYKKMESIHFKKYSLHENASLKVKGIAARLDEDNNPIIIKMKLK